MALAKSTCPERFEVKCSANDAFKVTNGEQTIVLVDTIKGFLTVGEIFNVDLETKNVAINGALDISGTMDITNDCTITVPNSHSAFAVSNGTKDLVKFSTIGEGMTQIQSSVLFGTENDKVLEIDEASKKITVYGELEVKGGITGLPAKEEKAEEVVEQKKEETTKTLGKASVAKLGEKVPFVWDNDFVVPSSGAVILLLKSSPADKAKEFSGIYRGLKLGSSPAEVLLGSLGRISEDENIDVNCYWVSDKKKTEIKVEITSSVEGGLVPTEIEASLITL